MSTALDHFATQLVEASRVLRESNGFAAGGARRAPGDARVSGEPGRAPLARRLRDALMRRRTRAAAGVLAIAILAGAGSTLFGPRGNPRMSLALQCGQAMLESVTGEPVRDCTTLWPVLNGAPAPRLRAWVASTGGAVVVVPAGAPPAGESVFHWKRLPAGFTQDRAAALLRDQLEDVAGGLSARACWSPRRAESLVAGTLRADGLASWRVAVKREGGAGGAGCTTADASVEAAQRAVVLIERRVPAPRGGSFLAPSARPRRERIAHAERSVVSALSALGAPRCASASRAAALWRQRARAAGVAAGEYVLFTARPASATPSRCASVAVDGPWGGSRYDVVVIGAA